jgi:hypothetical protein
MESNNECILKTTGIILFCNIYAHKSASEGLLIGLH